MTHRRGLVALVLTLAVVVAGCATWTTYGHDAGRSNADPVAPVLTPARHAWTSPTLDGMVYAQPLVYRDRVYVATENNTIYALDVATGAVRWRAHLGPPVPRSLLPCGNIDPTGITGTPVIDTASNVIYAVGFFLTPTLHHTLIGLDAATGALRVAAPADLYPFDPKVHQQRAALAIANGRVYWAYGGLAGDCGSYIGRVQSVRTNGTSQIAYVVPAHLRAAIWAPSGPAVDAQGNVWVSTGNGDNASTFDHGSSVIKLSPTLHELGFFAPTNWAALNIADLDLGSTGPLMLPGGFVFEVGKSGQAFVVRQSSPGGIGGQVASLSLGCGAFGGNAFWGDLGVVFVPCTDGTRAVNVGPGGALRFVWKGPSDANGPPVFAGGVVWVVANGTGKLYVLNPFNGAVLQQFAIGGARHFAAAGVGAGLVAIPTDTTVQAFRHV